MSRIVKHHYKACGLPNIWIRCRCVIDDAGNKTFIIPNIRGLHKLIAYSVVHSGGALTGAELKFLRSEMNMTPAELGKLVNRTGATIARWERGANPPDKDAEKVIRQHAFRALNLEQVAPQQTSRRATPPAARKSVHIDVANRECCFRVAA